MKPTASLRQLKVFTLSSMALFFLGASALVITGLNDTVFKADVIIVPGNTILPDGTPSPRLQARLDVALQLFREQRAPLIFVSGGRGKEGFDEAGSMFQYLVNQGVPPEAIVQDSFGNNTEATAANAAGFMRACHLTTAIVATQYFHVARTKLALEANGVKVVGNAHAHYFEARDLYSIPRELVAYIGYFVESKTKD
jgi:vancomycin permeability regulator SanA